MSEQRELVRLHIDAASEYGWMGGESFSEYVGKQSTYSKSSVAIDPFRTLGVLRAGFGSGLTVNGISLKLTAMKTYLATERSTYGMDIKSNIYRIDNLSYNVSIMGALNASTYTNEDYALEIHKNALYAAYNVNATTTRVSKFSPLSGGGTWNISFNCSLLAFALNSLDNPSGYQMKHVLLSFKGYLLMMHGNCVDYTAGDSGVLLTGCRLPDNMVIKTACDYGNQVAIGASDNFYDPSYRGNAKVYLYDGFSQDWSREISFPDTIITNLHYANGELLAWSPNGMYRFDGSGFELVDNTANTVTHGGVDDKDGFTYYKGSNVIKAYGKPIAGLPPAIISPITGAGTNGAVKWVTQGRLLVSAEDNKLYHFRSTFNETSAYWISRLITMPKGQKFVVTAVKLVFGTLATGDVLNVYLRNEAGTDKQCGTISYSVDGAVNSKIFAMNQFTDVHTSPFEKVQVYLSFSGGSVQVISVDLTIETVPEI